MRVPMTVSDFLDRAELVYGDRVGVVDEPDQPGPAVGTVTYGRVAERARAGRRGSTRSASARASAWRWSATTRPACSCCCSA